MQHWQGVQTGWTCSVEFDMTSRLRQPTNETALAMMEGLNITIALLIKLGRGPYRGDPNWAGKTWDEVTRYVQPHRLTFQTWEADKTEVCLCHIDFWPCRVETRAGNLGREPGHM